MGIKQLGYSLMLGALLLACSKEDTQQPSGQGGSSAGGASSGGTHSGGTHSGGSGGSAPEVREIQAFNRVRINSHSDQENFQNAITEIEFGEGPFQHVSLEVELDTTCFPFESWLGPNAENRPPSGERWPADCDAYDRNFEFSLNDPEGPEDPPGIELVRAITPFGGPMRFEVDITDIANGLGPGKHRLRSHITTWSDGDGQVSGSNGGWYISARVKAILGPAPRKVLKVIPIFNGSHGPPGPGALSFEVPEGVKETRLEYRATGHGGVSVFGGGCVGGAEEFCKREHRLYLDGQTFATERPWRDNCGELCTEATSEYLADTYCAENPCGAKASVRAPRANWCPGSVTPPLTWALPELSSPGEHSFEWKITPFVEGGSWRISATLFAFGDTEAQ